MAVSDAALLGTALLYVIQIAALFQWVVRQSSEVGLYVSRVIDLFESGSHLGHPRLLGPSCNSETEVLCRPALPQAWAWQAWSNVTLNQTPSLNLASCLGQ